VKKNGRLFQYRGEGDEKQEKKNTSPSDPKNKLIGEGDPRLGVKTKIRTCGKKV